MTDDLESTPLLGLGFNDGFHDDSTSSSSSSSSSSLSSSSSPSSRSYPYKAYVHLFLFSMLSVTAYIAITLQYTNYFGAQMGVTGFQFDGIEIDKSSIMGICQIEPSVTHASYTCEGHFLNFKVKADELGMWPTGLTWTVMQDTKDLAGILSRFHYEPGPTDLNVSLGTDCSYFSKTLCLSGDFTLYVNAANLPGSQTDESTYYVDICSGANRVHVGETLDFSTQTLKCEEDSFENSVPTKKMSLAEVPVLLQTERSYILKTDAGDSMKVEFEDIPTAMMMNEIFDATPVADEVDEEDQEPTKTAVKKGLKEIKKGMVQIRATEGLQRRPPAADSMMMAEITDPTPVSDGEDSMTEESTKAKVVALAKQIISISNADTSIDAVLLTDSSTIADEGAKLKSLLETSTGSTLAAEILDPIPVADEDVPEVTEHQEQKGLKEKELELVTHIINMVKADQSKEADLLGDASTMEQKAQSIHDSYADKSADLHVAPSKQASGVVNPWNLNPYNKQVPVAKKLAVAVAEHQSSSTHLRSR